VALEGHSFVGGERRDADRLRKLSPEAAVERPAVLGRAQAAPMLEER
jgi:hypothetical protein